MGCTGAGQLEICLRALLSVDEDTVSSIDDGHRWELSGDWQGSAVVDTMMAGILDREENELRSTGRIFESIVEELGIRNSFAEGKENIERLSNKIDSETREKLGEKKTPLNEVPEAIENRTCFELQKSPAHQEADDFAHTNASFADSRESYASTVNVAMQGLDDLNWVLAEADTDDMNFID
mmetsp:Transcript_4423/g.7768  ORF Transcript_4423/g.7768 Transcript_4423/m.7768 type:complete len:181 (-) Transcript_4423:1043-1585(-)